MTNSNVNKVVLGNETLVDLTGDTVTAARLLSGYTAHDASGAQITGTYTGGEAEAGTVTQDQDGYLVLDDDSGMTYQTVSKTYTPSETAQTDTITASSGYDAIQQVNVDVGAISSSYVGSGITRRNSTDLGESGGTVTVPSGYYASSASKSVPSGSVSASASKGSVSNNSVSVTPTATVGTAGYLAAGSANGTAVTVSASELVSGNKAITANGTDIDVANYSTVSVAVGGMSETDLKNFIGRFNTFKSIVWPDGLTYIGPYAFYRCTNFDTASLPSTVTNIDTSAFENCTQLKLTSLPGNIINIGTAAFKGCTSLALTSIPNGVTTISSSVFFNCTNLAISSLPSGVKGVIGSGAFQHCANITVSTIPSGVTSFGNYAFAGCSSITSLSCDGVLTSVAQYSFVGTTNCPMNIESVSFPNTATTSSLSTVFGHTTAANACQSLEFCDIGSIAGISANSFANCYSLEVLILRKTASITTLANVNAFTNTPMSGYGNKTGTVYVPSALISSYQTATNWSTLYSAGTVAFEAIEGSDYELE